MPSTSSSTRPSRDKKKILAEQKEYQQKTATALRDSDDPLAAYDKFVRWTLDNFSKSDPQSNLIPLLKEVTSTFEDDKIYKGDLRYLKIWLLYIRCISTSAGLDVYTHLVQKEIGTEYVAMWQGYATALEAAGRHGDAEDVYQNGIRRNIRRVEKLQQAYDEFKARQGPSPSNPPTKPSSSDDAKRVKFHPVPRTEYTTTLASAEARYAVMLAPPPPGKRPEKLRFNFDLLFSDGIEYSGQEVRAKSQGLLGKKWPPYPPDLPSPPKRGATAGGKGRKSVMMGEPTVTINTKEALADVFGMYNSPEKTRKLAGVRMRGFEPATPVAPEPLKSLSFVQPTPQQSIQTPAVSRSVKGENATRTPAPAFQPFKDENMATPAVNTRTPSAFRPFSDENAKTPANPKAGQSLVTPRSALGFKESAPVSAKETILEEDEEFEEHPPVFTPAATKISPFTIYSDTRNSKPPNDTLQPNIQSSSGFSVFSAPKTTPVFKPFVDGNAKTPFSRVFSPPSSAQDVFSSSASIPQPQQENEIEEAEIPSARPFAPYQDIPILEQANTLRDPDTHSIQSTTTDDSASTNPSWAEDGGHVVRGVGVIEDYQDDFDDDDNAFETDDDDQDGIIGHPPDNMDSTEDEGDSIEEQAAPLGGRFGQFNVMTPITERTFEFTERAEILPLDLGVVNEQDEGDHTYSTSRARHEYPNDFDEELAGTQTRTSGLTLSEALSIHSHFNPPNPCSPFDDNVMETLLSLVPHDNHVCDRMSEDSNLLEPLNKFAKGKGGSVYTLQLENRIFDIHEKLGEGGFGSVFKAREKQEDEDLDFDDDEETTYIAIKIVSPTSLWEYHVLRRMHAELPSNLTSSIVQPHELYAFGNESVLVMDYCPQGTLLNVVNNAGSAGVSQQGACLDELLVMFFSIELLRLLEGLHTAGFIHGDLKIDNCMVRLEEIPGGNSGWQANYDPAGGGGWCCKGLKLIDFGRSIDTKLFPVDQQFIADWRTDDRDCPEIREDRPWTFETDYYGLAGIIYCMLFGKYMQSTVVAPGPDTGRLKLTTPFKRYWQGQLWTSLFDILLNSGSMREESYWPLINELGEIRKQMEVWLQANCNRASGTLKGLLKKVEIAVA